MENGSTVLSPVVQAGGVWRVQITWANGSKHRIGKFGDKREAEMCIEDHRWLTGEDKQPASDRGADWQNADTIRPWARRSASSGE